MLVSKDLSMVTVSYDGHLATITPDSHSSIESLLKLLASSSTIQLDEESITKYIGGPIPLINLANTYDYLIASRVGDSLAIPTGLLSRLSLVSAQYTDRTLEFSVSLSPLAYQLRDYQRDAVEAALLKKRGIIKMPTGSGKAFCIAELALSMSKETRVVVGVTSKVLLYQLRDEFIKYGIEDKLIGLVGDGNREWDATIVIGITNTLAIALDNLRDCEAGEDEWNDYSKSMARLSSECGCYVQDEAHLVATNSGYKISELLSNTRYRIALSATPWTNTGLDSLLVGLFGPSVYSMSETQAIDGGYIARPLIRVHKAPKAWAPSKLMSAKYSHGVYNKLYNYLVLNNKARNELIVELALEFLKSDRGPIAIVVNKVNTKPSHPDMLIPLLKAGGYDPPVLSSKTSTKHFSDALDGLRSGSIRVAIFGPGVLKEGANIPSLGCVLLAGAGSSDIALIQRAGRCLRVSGGKDRGLIIDIADTQSYFASQARTREEVFISTYGSENVEYV